MVIPNFMRNTISIFRVNYFIIQFNRHIPSKLFILYGVTTVRYKKWPLNTNLKLRGYEFRPAIYPKLLIMIILLNLLKDKLTTQKLELHWWHKLIYGWHILSFVALTLNFNLAHSLISIKLFWLGTSSLCHLVS